MSINPISPNVAKVTVAPQVKPNNSVQKVEEYKKPEYTGQVNIDANKNIRIATWIPNSFDSNYWQTLSPDGTAHTISCWDRTGKGKTYQSDELKDLYNKVMKEYQEKGPIEGQKAAEISKQIDDIVKNLSEKQ